MDADSVTQHLDNLFAIKPRELLFNPEVGLDIESALFDPVDDETAESIYSITAGGFRRWDDRVNINLAQSVIAPFPDQGLYEITLRTNIKGLSEEYDYSGQLLSRVAGAQ